jgi:hypothetical protein
MADLSITAAQVLPGSDAASPQFAQGIAGAAITAGQALYLDSTTNTYKLADNDATAAAESVVAGIALHAAGTGQPIRLQTAGPITLGAGAAPAVATIYCLSATAGGIAPSADLATGDRTTILGVGGASNTIILRINSSLQVKP